MKILVCGSEGSLMQATIPKLLDLGHEVYGVDSLMRYGTRRKLIPWNYKFLRADLVDPYAVDDVFAQCLPDVVINAAARIYGIGGFNAYPADILGSDVTLQNNLLKAANDYKIRRFIYISSSMVYETLTKDGVHETDTESAIIPYTDYGLSKIVGERLCEAYQKQYGLTFTIWRPFNIITPYELSGSDPQGTSHVFADFIQNIVVEKKNPLPIIGDGNQVRCFTWIHDVAEAIANYSFMESTENEIFNLGRREPITMRELAGMIYNTAIDMGMIESLGDLTFQTTKVYSNDVQLRIPDVSRAKNHLGWEARTPLKDSIFECLDYLQTHPKETDVIINTKEA